MDDTVSERERTILDILVAHEQGLFPREIIPLVQFSGATVYLRRMLDKGLIFQANNGRYFVSMPLDSSTTTDYNTNKNKRKTSSPVNVTPITLNGHTTPTRAITTQKSPDVRPPYFLYEGKVYPGHYPDDLPSEALQKPEVTIVNATPSQRAIVPRTPTPVTREPSLMSLPIPLYKQSLSMLGSSLRGDEPEALVFYEWQRRCVGESNLQGGTVLSEERQAELWNQCSGPYTYQSPRYHTTQRYTAPVQPEPVQPSGLGTFLLQASKALDAYAQLSRSQTTQRTSYPTYERTHNPEPSKPSLLSRTVKHLFNGNQRPHKDDLEPDHLILEAVSPEEYREVIAEMEEDEDYIEGEYYEEDEDYEENEE